MSNAYSGIKKKYYANFGFEGSILISVAKKKKYFSIWSPMNLKKISSKLQKMTFYIVILAMFNFIVIMPLPADMGIVLGLPGTYKIILERQKFPRGSFNFTT